jgi:chromosome partitioning protein
MNFLAVANQKGGVGKTTTAVNLAACLAEKGQKVLLVDVDSQANATSALGLEKMTERSLYRVLTGQATPAETIIRAESVPVDVLPSEKNLAGVEAELTDNPARLKEVLAPVLAMDYQWVILDSPPSFGALMTQTLVAAHRVMIPVQCEYLAMEGLAGILEFIGQVRDAANSALRTDGILMTMFDARTRLSQIVVDDVRKTLEGREYVYKTVIPRTIRLAEAPSYGQPITVFDNNSTAALAYRTLAAELLQRSSAP